MNLETILTPNAPTPAGQAAFKRAEEIFTLGQSLPDEVREAATGRVAQLSVGLSDGISKLAAHALLAPVLETPDLRLVCHEGEVEQLLARTRLLASGAAEMTETTATVTVQGGSWEMLVNETGARLLNANLLWIGPAN